MRAGPATMMAFSPWRGAPWRRAREVALLIAASCLAGCATESVPTPLQLTIVPGAQPFANDREVWGLCINAIYGNQEVVRGLDAGFFNEVGTKLQGVGVGALNIAREDATGMMLGLGGNGVLEDFAGLQLAIGNQVDGDMAGAQVGFGSIARGMYGVQIGAVSLAGEGAGFQLGLIANQADSLKGLQIGLLNFNGDGFLPFFPFFNIGW